ncbi:MAG: hypothetical protein HY831_02080 [Candidatus Aenigmarchaeota archaeon]|nr:hypothetical protein [Candidatus Aenigmarchaeota archaeon]
MIKTRKICPNCRSIYIGLWMGTDLGMKYQCNECGYIGNIVLEEPVKPFKTKYNHGHSKRKLTKKSDKKRSSKKS